MSLTQLRERIRVAADDDRITLAEVESFLRSAMADGSVNEMEDFLLGATLEAYGKQFEPAALTRLEDFLVEARKAREATPSK